jgi:hypothetical protein
MRQNLDDEAYYESEDENGGRPSDRARDHKRDWLTEQGWDSYVSAGGEVKPWWPGMGYPDPIRRITDENRDSLDRAFYLERLRKAAMSTPEVQWLVEQGLWNITSLLSYQTDGSIVVTFANAVDAERFASTFRIAA